MGGQVPHVCKGDGAAQAILLWDADDGAAALPVPLPQEPRTVQVLLVHVHPLMHLYRCISAFRVFLAASTTRQLVSVGAALASMGHVAEAERS
jgi:hypothetical protein